MLYGPGEKETAAIARVIRDRSEKAKLPPVVLSKLLQLIDQQANYDDVKKELFCGSRFCPTFYSPARTYGER
jgi:hypothetical protein